MIWMIKGALYNIKKEVNKMGFFLNVQLSVFTNQHIDTTAKNISCLMEKLNKLGKYEFLPNVVTGQNIDLFAGVINATSNLSFITNSQSCKIVCMDERIDCVLNYEESCQEDLDTSLDFCVKVFSTIMGEFSVLGNRLAININRLGDCINSDSQHKFVNGIFDYYKDKLIDEWSMRVNTRDSYNIKNVQETINVISELSIAKNAQSNERRMLCHLDINTTPEKVEYRFGEESVVEFVSKMKQVINNLLSEFGE